MLFAAGATEPAPVDDLELVQRGRVIGEPPAEEKVQVAEAPGDEAEARDAEERVENLRGDLDPDASRGVDVAAGRMAHCGSGVAEEEEEHAAPGDYVEEVDCYEEALRGGTKVSFR